MTNLFKNPYDSMAGGYLYDIDHAGSDLFYLEPEPPQVYFGFENKQIGYNRALFNIGSDILEHQFNLLERWFFLDDIQYRRYNIAIIYINENKQVSVKTFVAEGGVETSFDPSLSNYNEVFAGYQTEDFSHIFSPTMSWNETIASAIGSLLASQTAMPSVFGSILGIVAVDALTGEGINATAIAGNIASSAISTVSKGFAVSALGLTGLTATVVGLAIGMVIQEAIEVASGLDISFGLGGDLMKDESKYAGVNIYNDDSSLLASFGFTTPNSLTTFHGFSFPNPAVNPNVPADVYDMASSWENAVSQNADVVSNYSPGALNYPGSPYSGYEPQNDNKYSQDDYINDFVADMLNDPYSSISIDEDDSSGFGGFGGTETDGVTNGNSPGGVNSVGDYGGYGDTGLDGGLDSGGDSYCCSYMIDLNEWSCKDRRDLIKWHLKQSDFFRNGYDVGGKKIVNIISKYSFLKKPFIKSMNAIYARLVLKKRITFWTILGYSVLYSFVYFYGIFDIIKRTFKKGLK